MNDSLEHTRADLPCASGLHSFVGGRCRDCGALNEVLSPERALRAKETTRGGGGTDSSAPSPSESFSMDQVRHSIHAFLKFGEDTKGESHNGYFSDSGFAARCLRWHLNQLEPWRGQR